MTEFSTDGKVATNETRVDTAAGRLCVYLDKRPVDKRLHEHVVRMRWFGGTVVAEVFKSRIAAEAKGVRDFLANNPAVALATFNAIHALV